MENLTKKSLYFVVLIALSLLGFWIFEPSPESTADKFSNFMPHSRPKANSESESSQTSSHTTAKAAASEDRKPAHRANNSGPRYVTRPSPLVQRPLGHEVAPPKLEYLNNVIIDESLPSLQLQALEYVKLENLVAISHKQKLGPEYNVVGKYGFFQLVRLEEGQTAPGNALTVIKDQDSTDIAIFTGILRVKLVDYEKDVENIIQDASTYLSDDIHFSGASIKNKYDKISLATYQFDDYSTLIAIYKILSGPSFSGRVERVTIDLIKWSRDVR